RRRRKKEIIMPQREVDYALSFEPMAPLEPELLASLEAMGLGLDPDLVAFREKQNRWMLSVQEDFMQQIADKGYVSTAVEVNDDEDGEED
uniref:Uncharacterized protein n=1 Tax=Setaria italica TaxID=4555 RepID=K3XPH4_SETIT